METTAMKRREMLLTTGAAFLGLSAFPLRWVAGAQNKPVKILYFTRCAGFLHSVVKRNGDELSYSEKLMVEAGKEHDVEVVCSKDGRVFDGDLDQFDAFAFYTSGDVTKASGEKTPPMSVEGKKRLLDAVAAGKGFVGIHAGNDTFRAPGDQIDPYIAMLGGEFIVHGPQQKAKTKVVDPKFPGADKLGESFDLHEEWYTHKKFAKDLHVILVQETEGMKGDCYQRPPYPSTWARMHGKGRVFYTSMGHREDVWTNQIFQDVLLGGFSWVLKNVDADVTPNIDQVTPKASLLRNA
jgi:type 1 glutamine amidotransferase